MTIGALGDSEELTLRSLCKPPLGCCSFQRGGAGGTRKEATPTPASVWVQPGKGTHYDRGPSMGQDDPASVS